VRIQNQDMFHGAALTQIVESSDFTALNRDPDKYGMYLLNHDRRLLIKHASAPRADGKYAFTFRPDDLELLAACEEMSPGKVFLALVCGSEVICGLSMETLAGLVDLGASSSQWVTIEAPTGKKLRTRGSLGDGPLVAQNAFPQIVLA